MHTIPFLKSVFRTIYHMTHLTSPSNCKAQSGTQWAPQRKSCERRSGMPDLFPSSSSLLRSIVCRLPFIKILFHNDRFVMEVKMSLGYQSESITTFKDFRHRQSSNLVGTPDALKKSAWIFLKVWQINTHSACVLAPWLLDQLIKLVADEPQIHHLSFTLLSAAAVVILSSETVKNLWV